MRWIKQNAVSLITVAIASLLWFTSHAYIYGQYVAKTNARIESIEAKQAEYEKTLEKMYQENRQEHASMSADMRAVLIEIAKLNAKGGT